MKTYLFKSIILISLFALLFDAANAGEKNYKPSEKYYGIGSWSADSLGNHRALIKVNKSSSAVFVHLPWRRSDTNPSEKGVVIMDAKTGEIIKNIVILEINNEYGDMVFEPVSGSGDYYVYFMPYQRVGLLYWGQVKYLTAETTPDKNWLIKNNLTLDKNKFKPGKKYPEAELIQFQARTAHDSFYPMEIIAAPGEVQKIINKYGKDGYLIFPEDRKYPVMMKDHIPFRWVETAGKDYFKADVLKNEYFSFQIGLYAFKEALSDIEITFNDLKSKNNSIITSSHFESINIGGKDWEGKSILKKIDVDNGKVKAIWISVDIPKDANPGVYNGSIIIRPKGKKEKKILLTLNVIDKVLDDKGDSEPWRHSRLRWLNSQIAQDDEIVKPYTPMKKEGKTITCLGRSLTLGTEGFPNSIKSYFASSLTEIINKPKEILYSPVVFNIRQDGKDIKWQQKEINFPKTNDGVVEWQFENKSGVLTLHCNAKMEFDGRVEYKIELSSSEDINVDDISLLIPFQKNAAKYAMGMNLKGGFRPKNHSWKWDVEKNQDNIWIGDVNAGLQLQMKGDNYVKPLVNLHYHHRKIRLPESWNNDGKGGCTFAEDSSSLLLKAFTGDRQLQAGKKLNFTFSLLITPFKTLDTKGQWSDRYYHAPGNIPILPVDSIAKMGANVVNIHHARYMNPYINYPFLRVNEMKAYVDEAHKNNTLLKIYYTVREMSNYICEMGALRSLDDEIFAYGPGKGDAWLQEHLYDNYIPAWYDLSVRDGAIITSGMSRLHNYYLEGLDWLTKNVGIDGLYLDDVAYDRTVMKRVRKILDRNRPKALIDLHSWNHYDLRAGLTNNANLYMESLPYVNRIWFGELFDYENTLPDYWLIEISGIPYGLMGEMLGDNRGGNVYRGMVYGITNRLPWTGDPRGLWKIWDDFGIQESKMIGYWSEECPVKTNFNDVLATAYIGKSKTMIALASWNKNPQNIKMTIDWKKLGIDPSKATLSIPAIPNFQESKQYSISDSIRIEPRKGLLMIIKEN
jgi:hypothetical protein